MIGAFKDQQEEQCGWSGMSRDDKEEMRSVRCPGNQVTLGLGDHCKNCGFYQVTESL